MSSRDRSGMNKSVNALSLISIGKHQVVVLTETHTNELDRLKARMTYSAGPGLE